MEVRRACNHAVRSGTGHYAPDDALALAVLDEAAEDRDGAAAAYRFALSQREDPVPQNNLAMSLGRPGDQQRAEALSLAEARPRPITATGANLRETWGDALGGTQDAARKRFRT